jgi:hypothetical protein
MWLQLLYFAELETLKICVRHDNYFTPGILFQKVCYWGLSFSLTALLELWLQWLDDEEQTALTQDNAIAVYELYGRAVQDYICIAPLP